MDENYKGLKNAQIHCKNCHYSNKTYFVSGRLFFEEEAILNHDDQRHPKYFHISSHCSQNLGCFESMIHFIFILKLKLDNCISVLDYN